MANAVLTAPHFQNEEAAFAYVEAKLWPNGPVCPHCGNDDQSKIGRLQGKTTRPGLYKCYAVNGTGDERMPCRKPFTVRIGTIFEDSHLALHLWLQVIHLFACSKKGISTRQIQRMLQCSMKTAWFLGMRIRLAMDPSAAEPMGGAGKTVEADETELARSRKTKRPEGFRRSTHNPKVLSLVERGGNLRSVTLDHRGVGKHLRAMVHADSRLVTDQAQHYKFRGFAQHDSVDHSKFEWSRGDIHTNTLEGFFSVLKRGLVGVYQHVDKHHLDRYLAEFDFRHNNREKLGINDTQRAELALKGMVGKRLTYGTVEEAPPF